MGQGARPPGAAQAPLPGLGWKSGCALDSCIFKVGRWARGRRPRAALNCTGASEQLFAEPWTARLEGAARDAGARPGPAGQRLGEPGSGPRGPSNPRAWASAPDALLGAPRRGRAPRGGQALAPPCGGLGTAWPPFPPNPPSSQAGRDPRPPTSRTPRPAEGAASRLRSWAGPGVLGHSRAAPPRRVNYSWGAAGVAPKTCSALGVSGEVGGRR